MVNRLSPKSARGAQGAGHNFALQNYCSPMQPGLQRKSHRICIGKSEELERKARFFAEQKMRTDYPEK
jgi:hypothetical protein